MYAQINHNQHLRNAVEKKFDIRKKKMFPANPKKTGEY